MDDDTIVCTCMNVRVKDMKQIIMEGAETFQEFQDKSGAGTICGVCLDEAELLFTELKDSLKK